MKITAKTTAIGFVLAAISSFAASRPTIPKIDVASSFSSPGADAGVTNEEALARWWLALDDPILTSLIKRAAESNLDLKLASERLLEARAARRLSRSDLFPTVEGGSSAQRIRGGFNQGIIHVGGNGSPGLISAFETNVFQLGFDASWELDFFGGKRRALEAATAQVKAGSEAVNDVLVSLLAEVGRNYVELRGAQRRLQLTRDNIYLQKESLHLTEVRAEAGLGNSLDVSRQKSQLESTEASAPQLEASIAVRIHALSILLAKPPDALFDELSAATAMPQTPPEVPAGLPSDLLKRRPDIRRVEAEIAAAAANVGVAKAEFFPKITLTGSAGRQSANFSGLTLGAGNFFSIGPSVKLPIFTGGRLRANLAVQKERLDESMTTYQSTVLQSLRETEDALSQYNSERQRRELVAQSVHSSEEATKLARDLYVSGLADFLSVIDAQRQQLSLETELAASDTNALTALVALYKALGGGWSRTHP
jgi:NodT family efflux transporter outer membrane factor (OMF) lipoprotein